MEEALTEWLGAGDVARMRGVSKATVANWRADGTALPYSRYGKGTVRYKRSDVVEFLRVNARNAVLPTVSAATAYVRTKGIAIQVLA